MGRKIILSKALNVPQFCGTASSPLLPSSKGIFQNRKVLLIVASGCNFKISEKNPFESVSKRRQYEIHFQKIF